MLKKHDYLGIDILDSLSEIPKEDLKSYNLVGNKEKK